MRQGKRDGARDGVQCLARTFWLPNFPEPSNPVHRGFQIKHIFIYFFPVCNTEHPEVGIPVLPLHSAHGTILQVFIYLKNDGFFCTKKRLR